MRHAIKLGLLVLCALFLATSVAQAQAPGDAIFAVIANDLSLRVGKPISFTRLDGSYQFEEIKVTDNALGCPQAGVSAPGITRAWKIVVTLNNLGTYDYRATGDAKYVFFCTGTGVGATTGTPVAGTPLPPVPTAGNPGTPIAVQGTLMAYVGIDGNVYVTSLGGNGAVGALTTEQPRPVGAFMLNQHLNWSPDGTRLAYVHRAENQGILYVAASGQAPLQVASGIETAFDISWSPDGREIAYVVPTAQPAAGGQPNDMVYQVQAVPATGGQPRVAATLAIGVGCGGGGWPPSTIRYFDDTGYGGNNQPIFWTTSGFVHAVNCTGADGLALTRFDGQRAWKLTGVARAALSPDRTQLAVISFDPAAQRTSDDLPSNGIGLINIATGQMRVIPTTNLQPTQVSWSGDGQQLLFSTRVLARTVPGDPARAQVGQQVFLGWPATAQSYTLTLYALPLAGGNPVSLFSQEGGYIGKIVASPTVAVVAFGFIESEVAMMNRLNAGGSVAEVQALTPKIFIGVSALSTGVAGYPYLLPTAGGQPAFSRANQFIAVAGNTVPVVPATGDNPLGLQIGGRAVVPAGGNVNIRQNPSTTATVLGIIRPGDTVTVLAGPTSAEGLRWWQVRRESDGVVGWVADTDRQGIVNIQPVK